MISTDNGSIMPKNQSHSFRLKRGISPSRSCLESKSYFDCLMKPLTRLWNKVDFSSNTFPSSCLDYGQPELLVLLTAIDDNHLRPDIIQTCCFPSIHLCSLYRVLNPFIP
jgi:hypothetical protein